MVEAVSMNVSGQSFDTANLVAVQMQKLAQDQAKLEGTKVVQLIEQATPPPIGLHGEGTHVNTYA